MCNISLSPFTEINYCEVAPCRNGGTCRNLAASQTYSCNCVVGYTGRNCQTGELRVWGDFTVTPPEVHEMINNLNLTLTSDAFYTCYKSSCPVAEWLECQHSGTLVYTLVVWVRKPPEIMPRYAWGYEKGRTKYLYEEHYAYTVVNLPVCTLSANKDILLKAL